MVGTLISEHLGDIGVTADDVKRFWLHQANLAMNEFIARKVLGRDASAERSTLWCLTNTRTLPPRAPSLRFINIAMTLRSGILALYAALAQVIRLAA